MTGGGGILIRGSRIVDPARGVDGVGDVLIQDGVIVHVGGNLPTDSLPLSVRVIEGAGLVTAPGFIDLHCHLREPGFEYKETIASGTARGGPGGLHHRLLYAQH